MRFSKAAVDDGPNSVVGLCAMPPPSPCPTCPLASKCTTPPSAKVTALGGGNESEEGANSERFRPTPRTCGRYRGILILR
jgi:hypothetical protein